VVVDLQRRLAAAHAAQPASTGMPLEKVPTLTRHCNRLSLPWFQPKTTGHWPSGMSQLLMRCPGCCVQLTVHVCCPAQVQQLVQQLAEAEAARDALEARLVALSAGVADGMAASGENSSAHSIREGGSTLQKVHVATTVTTVCGS